MRFPSEPAKARRCGICSSTRPAAPLAAAADVQPQILDPERSADGAAHRLLGDRGERAPFHLRARARREPLRPPRPADHHARLRARPHPRRPARLPDQSKTGYSLASTYPGQPASNPADAATLIPGAQGLTFTGRAHEHRAQRPATLRPAVGAIAMPSGDRRPLPGLDQGAAVVWRLRRQAVFKDAQNLRTNSPVRIAGVNVGVVEAIEPTGRRRGRPGDHADRRRGPPDPRDARLQLRPRLFLEGNLFVDVHQAVRARRRRPTATPSRSSRPRSSAARSGADLAPVGRPREPADPAEDGRERVRALRRRAGPAHALRQRRPCIQEHLLRQPSTRRCSGPSRTTCRGWSRTSTRSPRSSPTIGPTSRAWSPAHASSVPAPPKTRRCGPACTSFPVCSGRRRPSSTTSTPASQRSGLRPRRRPQGAHRRSRDRRGHPLIHQLRGLASPRRSCAG